MAELKPHASVLVGNALAHDTDTGTVYEDHRSTEGLLYVGLARDKFGLTHDSLAENRDEAKDLGHQDPKHALNFAPKKPFLLLNESHAELKQCPNNLSHPCPILTFSFSKLF